MGDIIRLVTITAIMTAANVQCCNDSGGDDESLRVHDGVRKDAISSLKNRTSLFGEVLIYFAVYCCI